MDISGTAKTPRHGIVLSWLYAGGHSTVVAALGLAAVVVGLQLPAGVDSVMTVLVGATLVLLGIYVLYVVVRHPERDFRMQARWVLIGSWMYRAFRKLAAPFQRYELATSRLTSRLKSRSHAAGKGYGPMTAFLIGVIHGIGGETPTQILLFLLAAHVEGIVVGLGVVLVWVAGLFVTNTVEALLAALGYSRGKRDPRTFRRIAAAAAVFSVVIGAVFLAGASGVLPTLG